MVWRGILITLAVVAALYVAAGTYLRAPVVTNTCTILDVGHWLRSGIPAWLFGSHWLDGSDWLYNGYPTISNLSSASFPFRWQAAPRARLAALLAQPTAPPSGTDVIAQAKFAQYAGRHGSEALFREGIRREPGNALYHYWLAQTLIARGVKIDWESERTPDLPTPFQYTLMNRKLLDAGMRELAVGLRLPMDTHRGPLLCATLDAMPQATFLDRTRRQLELMSVLLPEYAMMRNLERVNGYYLSLLLKEGKRAAAEPYLHTGERLVMQASEDTPVTLIAQKLAIDISASSTEFDARVCRAYGWHTAADALQARHRRLTGRLAPWRRRAFSREEQRDPIITAHAGLMASRLLPVFTPSRPAALTADALAPSRLVEYVVAEGLLARVLCLFAALLLLFAGLTARGATTTFILTLQDWLRVIGFGLLAPLAGYLLFIALPVSGRGSGLGHAPLPFLIGAGVTALALLVGPALLAGLALRRHGVAYSPAAALAGVGWSLLALAGVAIPVARLLLWPFLATPVFGGAPTALLCGIAAVWTAVPLVSPRRMKRRVAARAMLPVYAVMTLCFAALVPVCEAAERHALRADTVMAPVVEGGDVLFSQIEGHMAQRLRASVRDGAAALSQK